MPCRIGRTPTRPNLNGFPTIIFQEHLSGGASWKIFQSSFFPLRKEVPAFHPLPVVSHAFDPDRIADVLARITVQRARQPMIRTVFFAR